MNRGLRQPLLWFVLIGVFLFVVDARFSVDRSEIVVSVAQQERLATLWQTQTGLIASTAELSALVDSWIREEVLYREALRLGLDAADTIIRRRLVQKLGFIAESEPSEIPTTTELQAYYRDNLADYTLPVRYSFRQRYFQTIEAAEQALQQISQGRDASEFGESSMLNADYAYRSVLDLNANFGIGFADNLVGLSVGLWEGPLHSGLGFHLVQLTALHPAENSPFPSVRTQVAMDYQQARQVNAREDYIDDLMDRYTIIRESR